MRELRVLGSLWAALLLGGCDDGGPPPAVDCAEDPGCVELPQVPARSWVLNACPVDEADRSRFDLTVAMVDADAAPVVPERLSGPATADRFTWLAASARPADGGFSRPVELASDEARHLSASGDPLIIIVMDHSASLAGGVEADPTGDPARASDPDDRRIAFFSGLIAALPAQTELALVTMAGLFGRVTVEPTTDREPVLGALTDLARDEIGGTPLARGLIDAVALADAHPKRDPIVVLFTDGVEDGDTSQRPDRPDPSSLADALAQITARDTPLPVHVLHLQTPGTTGFPLGRDATLAELACLTGGDYHFVASPTELHAERREALRARLLGGGWQVTVNADLTEPPAGGWVLDARSTALETEPVAGLTAWVWW